MPGGYTIDIARRLVISRGWGAVSGDDLLWHARAVRADPRFEPGFSQLADLSGVTDLGARPAAMRLLAIENPFGAGSRRAFVASSDVAFGMARMYELMTDQSPDESRVFRDLSVAIDWLGMAAAADDIRRTLAAAPAHQVP